MNNPTNKLIPELRFPEFLNDGEWVENKLDKLGKLIGGLTYSPSDVREKGLLVLRSSNVQNGYLDLNDCVFVDPQIKGANLTQLNDILICIRNGSKALIGKNAMITDVIPLATHGAFMTVFRAQNPKFVFQLFQTDTYTNQVNADLGATINSINGTNFLKYKFIIPKKPTEQQKIADCLSSLDEVITAHTNKLKTLKTYKKALMQNLFPQEGEKVPKLRFKEFEKDGEWKRYKLGEVADVSKLAGYEFTKHIKYESKGNIIALRGLNIKNNSLDLTDVKYIDNSDLYMLGRSKLYIDDLMFTYIGTIGEVALIKENNKFYLAPNVSRIRANKKNVKPKFLLQYFNIPHFKDVEISKFISSSSQPALTMGNVRLFSLLLPSLQEQEKIADTLSSLDDVINDESNKIKQLKTHKKGLMQGLFPKVKN